VVGLCGGALWWGSAVGLCGSGGRVGGWGLPGGMSAAKRRRRKEASDIFPTRVFSTRLGSAPYRRTESPNEYRRLRSTFYGGPYGARDILPVGTAIFSSRVCSNIGPGLMLGRSRSPRARYFIEIPEPSRRPPRGIDREPSTYMALDL
jgi:hypothetical protein